MKLIKKPLALNELENSLIYGKKCLITQLPFLPHVARTVAIWAYSNF